MSRSNQYSYFFLRGYFASADDVLKAVLACDVRHYAFVLHDRDSYTSGTEDHAAGDHKDDHWHICLNLQQKTSWNVVSGKILKLFPNCGIWNRNIYDPARAADYLMHNSDLARAQGKAQYTLSDIFSDNFDYWYSDEAKKDCDSEKSSTGAAKAGTRQKLNKTKTAAETAAKIFIYEEPPTPQRADYFCQPCKYKQDSRCHQ